MSTGEFPMSSLDTNVNVTLPNAYSVKSINDTKYRYLDKVHVGISSSDTASVGGALCVLFLLIVHYNFVFVLKSLSFDYIKATSKIFCAQAGRFATCSRADCKKKLFAIKSHSTNNSSDIIAVAAGHQSSNDIAGSHWKTMVHIPTIKNCTFYVRVPI